MGIFLFNHIPMVNTFCGCCPRILLRLVIYFPLFSGCQPTYNAVGSNNSGSQRILPWILRITQYLSRLSLRPNASLRGGRTTPLHWIRTSHRLRPISGISRCFPAKLLGDIYVWMKVLPPRHGPIFIYIPRQNF